MNSASINGSVSLAGTSFPIVNSQSDEGAISQNVAVPKGYEADTVTGVGTYAGTIQCDDASPDIDASDYVDIYWTLAGVNYVLYNADVSVSAAGLITIIDTNGLGDVLPANATACIISVRKEIVVTFTGTLASCLVFNCGSSKAHIAYVSSVDETAATEHYAHNTTDNEGWYWIEGMGFANPITGDTIAAIYVSTADTDADQVAKVGVLYDSVA